MDDWENGGTLAKIEWWLEGTGASDETVYLAKVTLSYARFKKVGWKLKDI